MPEACRADKLPGQALVLGSKEGRPQRLKSWAMTNPGVVRWRRPIGIVAATDDEDDDHDSRHDDVATWNSSPTKMGAQMIKADILGANTARPRPPVDMEATAGSIIAVYVFFSFSVSLVLLLVVVLRYRPFCFQRQSVRTPAAAAVALVFV
jgi:hypothetical protein